MKTLTPEQAAEIKTTWSPAALRPKLESLEVGGAILILKNEWHFSSSPRAYVGQMMGPGRFTILQLEGATGWLIKKL